MASRGAIKAREMVHDSVLLNGIVNGILKWYGVPAMITAGITWAATFWYDLPIPLQLVLTLAAVALVLFIIEKGIAIWEHLFQVESPQHPVPVALVSPTQHRTTIIEFLKQIQNDGLNLLGNNGVILDVVKWLQQAGHDGEIAFWGKRKPLGMPTLAKNAILTSIPSEHWEHYQITWGGAFILKAGFLTEFASDNFEVGTITRVVALRGGDCFQDVHLDIEQAKGLLARRSIPQAQDTQQEGGYLPLPDMPLSMAVYLMAHHSAWGKWFSAQDLAATLTPIDDRTLMNIAVHLVSDKAIKGELVIRGIPSDGHKSEVIPREAWHSIALYLEEDNRQIWKVVIGPYSGANPARIADFKKYDSLLVDAAQFESLWPLHDRASDEARKELLAKAKSAGADPAVIAALT